MITETPVFFGLFYRKYPIFLYDNLDEECE